MNKQKFVEYLRSPESLSTNQFEELEQLLVDYPYFSIAKSVAARASKNLNTDNERALVASAAIYATDRKHLKNYINGEVIFLTDAPKVVSTESEDSKQSIQIEVSESPSDASPAKLEFKKAADSDVDQILDELQRDMAELKKSREHFVEVQNHLDDEVVSRPIAKKEPKEVEKESKKIESKVPEEAKAKKESKKEESKSDSNMTNFIDSLKKEFEEDEVKDQKESSTPAQAEKKKAKPASKKTSKKETKEIDKKAKVEVAKPKKSLEPSPIVTNMDEGDEEEEPTPLDPKDKPIAEIKKKKLPARSNRGSRQKVKREDLEKLMGLPVTVVPAKEEEGKPAKKVVAKTEITKKETAKKKTVTKKTPETTIAAKTEIKGESEKTVKIISNKTEPQVSTDVAQTNEENQSDRSSAKSFLDFGGTGDMSSSVSRASSSKRKRSSRPSKSSKDQGEKKSGDDDDTSGPTGLIDKFIKENPSIKRRALKGEKPDLSEQSGEWQADMASEYLAEIYLKQGNKHRAIQIYEALILKFPEKKSYFAALIQKVQG